MSRPKKGVASEGKLLAAPKEGKAETADSTADLTSMMKTIMETTESINNRSRALEQHRHPSLAGAQEKMETR